MTTSNLIKCCWCGQSFAPGALDYIDHHNGTNTVVCESCLDISSTEPDPDTAVPTDPWYEPWDMGDSPTNDNNLSGEWILASFQTANDNGS